MNTAFFFYRLCGFEPFYDERGDQAMFQRILKCDYEFMSPWWDEVSVNAKVVQIASLVFFLLCYLSFCVLDKLTNVLDYNWKW